MINQINAGDLVLSADVSGRGEGRFKIPVAIEENDRFTVVSDNYLDVLIIRIPEETTPEETTEAPEETLPVDAQPQATLPEPESAE